MLDYIWSGIMLLSVVFSIMNGRTQELTSAAFSGSAAAVTLCIGLLGTVCFFSGIMRLAERGGITSAIAFLLSPVLRLLFPGINTRGETAGAICMNISANMLGLGNAATPFGLRAMSLLAKQESGDTASNDMITFVVLNTASVQLVPTTIAMLRSNNGCKNPMDIIVCVWITSFLSLAVGLLCARLPSILRSRRCHD